MATPPTSFLSCSVFPTYLPLQPLSSSNPLFLKENTPAKLAEPLGRHR
jgi:hypothetical protein